MRLKAIIWKGDRTNDAFKPRQKDIDGRVFLRNNCAYVIDPDCTQLTFEKRFFFFKKYYQTLYYVEGFAKPIPAPNMGGKPTLNADGTRTVTFPKALNLGVPADELAGIFNPWFYRIVAPSGKLMDKILFYMAVGIAAGLAILLWFQFTQPPITGEELRDFLPPGNHTASPTGGAVING